MAESTTGKRPASGDVEEEEEETDEEATLHGRRDQCPFCDIFSTEMIETLAYYMTVCELAHIRITCKAMYHGTRLPRSLLTWTSEFDPNKVYALEPVGLTGVGGDYPPSVAKQPIVLPPSITSNWLLGRESSADTDPRRKLVAPQKVALGIPRSENQISRKQASLTVARGHLVLKSVEAPSPVAVIRGPGRLPGEATEVMLHPEEAVRFRVGDTVVLDTWRKESHFTWRLITTAPPAEPSSVGQ